MERVVPMSPTQVFYHRTRDRSTTLRPWRWRTMSIAISIASVVFALIGRTAEGGFMDVTALTPGAFGSFAGTIDGVGVTGSITIPASNISFQFDVTGTQYFESTTDNTSPQYSYSNIYSPSIPLTDRVGYTSFSGTFNPATITINFSSPLTNPVFHVANLDFMQFDFSPTVGLAGLTLLSGNGGGGDGIQVVGNIISDANNTSQLGIPPTDPPPTTGPRSAYGSVELLGTFQTLTINVVNPNLGGDGGSFTISATVPETSSTLPTLLSATVLLILVHTLRRPRVP